MPNKQCWPKVGERVAYKKTNDRRSKWRHGQILEVEVKNKGGHPIDMRVRWDDGSVQASGVKEEAISSVASYEPRVLIFVAKETLPPSVAEWCEENGTLAVRYVPTNVEMYVFVEGSEPYHEVTVCERSVSRANLRYLPSVDLPDDVAAKDSDGTEGGHWSNDKFEQDDCDISMGAGDDAIDMPEDYEPEW